MDETGIKKSLEEWLENFVEVPNPKLGDWPPCPFARQARLSNKIEIKFADFPKFDHIVNQSLADLETKDVIIICFDHEKISANILQKYVQIANQKLMPLNYVILEDHPDIIEFINEVNMNFNKCGLLILQKLNKLNQASLQLKSKGYYNYWTKEEIDNVVSWRHS